MVGISPKRTPRLYSLIHDIDALEIIINKEKESLLEDAMTGNFLSDQTNQKGFWEEFIIFLNWLMSERKSARAFWQWLFEKNQTDRDTEIFNLIVSIYSDEHPNNKVLNALHEENKITASTYFEYYFNWFLKRYDLSSARRLLKIELFWINFPKWYLAVCLSVISTYFVLANPIKFNFSWTIAGFILIVIGALPAIRIARTSKKLHLQKASLTLWQYLQTFLPRLAITTMVGYSFLFSAGGLVSFLIGDELSHLTRIFFSFFLLLLVFLYSVQIIQRQIYPRLPIELAFRRSWHILILSLIYSSMGLFIAAPILFSTSFTHSIGIVNFPGTCWSQLILVASIALAIGVILQLVWEDKPVTEPL